MKIYTYNGETFNKLPNPIKTADGSTISPVSETLFLSLGGTITDDGEPTHMEELDAACDIFIAVVLEIAETIGDASFYGGINEQDKLLNSQYAKDHPTEALILAERWNGANLACNHFANKEDLRDTMASPNWFYYAWARYAEKLEAGK